MHQIIDFARERLGVKLYPGQAEALNAYYESGRSNWLLLSGRRGGKSLISDIVASYEAIVPDLSQYVRPGEERYVLMVSVREDSAKLHIRQIARLLRHSKELASGIEAIKEDRIQLKNGVTILSLPASARATRGYTASALVMDEAAFFVDTLGNSSAEAIFTALSPTVATFGEQSRIVITTSVNTKAGLVYEIYDRATSGELDEWHITKTATRELNPKVSEKVINQALRRDPESAQAEYFSEFREQLEAFLSSEAVDQCVDRSMTRLENGAGERYLMAIDPALMRDNYAYGIAHLQNGVVYVDYINRLKAPVNANYAEDLLRSLVERFKPVSVLCDNASTVQRLKGELPMAYAPFTRQQKLRIYGALKETINLGLVVLPPDDDLLAELKALQIRGGVDISAPKAGRITHDDLADCIALLVDGLQSNQFTGEAHTMPNIFYGDGLEGKSITRDFLYYPDGDWALAEGKNTRPHPPGVTFLNCRHRTRGCEACIREMEEAGWYEMDRQVAEAKAQEGQADPAPPVRDYIAEQGAERSAQLINNFWKSVRRTK
jgi:hypothetical protein